MASKRPQNDRIHLFASKGAAAMREKYPIEVRRAWAARGGAKKGKKRAGNVPSVKKAPATPVPTLDEILAELEALERS